MLNLTKGNLQILIKGIKAEALSNHLDWVNVFQDFINLLVLCFGEYNTNLILRFSLQYKNYFSNIDELYDYISDSYSSLVNNNSAFTIDQLVQLFPDENMFKTFQRVIKEHTNT